MIGKIGSIQPYLSYSSTIDTKESFSLNPNIEQETSPENSELSAVSNSISGGYTQPFVISNQAIIKV